MYVCMYVYIDIHIDTHVYTCMYVPLIYSIAALPLYPLKGPRVRL